MAPPPLLLLPLLAAAIALPPLPGAAAAGGVVKATQCMWGGALCDLSSGYVVTHLSDLVPDASALNATAAAMLRAAARDAACAARPTMQACKTGAEADGCEWFDAEVRGRAVIRRGEGGWPRCILYLSPAPPPLEQASITLGLSPALA